MRKFCENSKIMGRGRAAFFVALVSPFLMQCTKDMEGEYADPKSVEILGDRWNDTDARKTAEDMVRAMLNEPWLEEYKKLHKGERPIVAVDDIENKTDEHIDVGIVTDAIQDEIINSRRVRFIDKAQREKIIKEIKFQQESGEVSASTAGKRGKQIGVQYFLTGNVSSIVDVQGGRKNVSYQIFMKLTNLESSEIEWTNRYNLKKRFTKSSGKF